MNIYKKPFFEELLRQSIEDENYELSAYYRDTLKIIKEDDYWLMDDETCKNYLNDTRSFDFDDYEENPFK